MKTNRRLFILGLTVLTLTGTVSQSFAKKKKEEPAPVVRTDLSANDLAIKELFNSRMDLLNLITPHIEKKGTVDYSSLVKVVATLEAAAIKYFESAGITYVPKDEYNYETKYDGATIPPFKYRSFVISRIADGDFASAALNTFDKHVGKPEWKTTFIYHPVFELRPDGAYGAYNQVRKTMEFGPELFTNTFYGIGNTLRHENQHQIEQLRLEQGEFTLARFSFTNSAAQPGQYRTFLGLDEIETHRLDLKYLADYAQRRDKEIERIAGNPVAMLKYAKDRRALHAKVYSSRFTGMIQRSRETLNAIRESVLKNQIPAQMDVRANKVVNFTGLAGPYPIAEVIIGKAGAPPVADIAKVLLEMITKAETKINYLEAEVIALTPASRWLNK